MSAIYDNWERLVAAVIKKQQLWQLCHDHSRSLSLLSDEASDFKLRSPVNDLGVDFARLGSSSTYQRAPKLVLLSDFSPAIDFKDAYVASAELLGRGTFGSAYVAKMDNGVRIVVKRLKPSSVYEVDFKWYMDVIGNVRHRNVAALRAYYSSEDERLLVYDYYSGGSVYELLHGRNGEPQAHVSWLTRLKIAIGAARGIAEIHTKNGGTLVHGNIKASNVFRNPDQYGCVSDLGLTKLVEKSTSMPTAHCYAPEVKNTRNVSQASDVYSFGVLLLELLTRKSTTHVPGGPEAVDLVELVTSVRNKEMAVEVFDVDLLKLPAIREQTSQLLRIGLRCVEKSIQKRPKMSEVVKMLEEIGSLYPIGRALETKKLVFIEDANPGFELEDILKASADVFGRGSFKTSYKATLENGMVFMVKRLRDVDVTCEDFQGHMEAIGRTRQENIAELRAYYYSKDEKLLVYRFYKQGSLSILLHGIGKMKNRRMTPLDWETRLKITVGAARGIAHIHRQDGRKLVHGKIKSSNIFLNTEKYGIVSDPGLGKVMAPFPITDTGIRIPDCYAPEVRDTRNVSQACDVYSFGVVLLEILSRKPSQFTVKDGRLFPLVYWVQTFVPDKWFVEVFDKELLKDKKKVKKEKENMVKVLKLAMDCVNTAPERRPRMSEVVKMLEDISGIEPLDYEPSVESRLEDLMEDLMPALTP